MIIKNICINKDKELFDFSLIIVFTDKFFKEKGDIKATFYFCFNDHGMLNIKKIFFSGREDIIDIWDNLNEKDKEQVIEDLSVGLDAYFNDCAFRWQFTEDEVLIIENGQYYFDF